jgi:hypothetical protein
VEQKLPARGHIEARGVALDVWGNRAHAANRRDTH